MTRTASGCTGLGWLPALNARTQPAERARASASASWDRALLPVHRNRTVDGAAAAPGWAWPGLAVAAGPGCSALPAPASDCAHRARSRW